MRINPRRITLYWLMLLLPALGMGVVAVVLLHREQRRLEAQTGVATAARRAAVEARAGLVVENIELLVGDVESGLLDTLEAEPAESLGGFLNEWERSNPLVRTAFLASPQGQLLRPAAISGNEERGFHRRFASRLAQLPPWAETAKDALLPTVTDSKAGELEEAQEARKQATLNVNSVQTARREVQALAKNRSVYAPNADAEIANAPAAARPSEGKAEMDDAPLFREKAVQQMQQIQAILPARRGWLTWQVEGRLSLLGWIWSGGQATVRGVELEMATLISRMGGALPPEVQAGEGYVLRDERGRVQHQAGWVPDIREVEPVVRVAISSQLLPGWEVAAWVLPAADTRDGVSFFWIGTLLTSALVIAIVTSGSLLLWQARRSEAEAAQKTSFVANVSHEFKTPLTTIRLYSELLEQGRVVDAEKRGEYLRTIGRETQRLARLVNNALDFSRLEQGQKKFQREHCDLGAELARLLDTHEPRVAEAGMELTRVLPVTPVMVTTDRDAVEQIVLNLVDNACKYAADGGEIHVELQVSAGGGSGVALRVSDRGPGVPESERERVFEKFHRVDETLTAEKSGTGLGLSIARQLARGLGGELRCEARPGGGAVFVFTLP